MSQNSIVRHPPITVDLPKKISTTFSYPFAEASRPRLMDREHFAVTINWTIKNNYKRKKEMNLGGLNSKVSSSHR